MDTPQIKESPRVSIVVIVYNGEKTLAACLDSLMMLDFPDSEKEIIVVDNNSTDNTKEIISRYPVKYVFEPIRGRGRARNAGIRASTGRYIAFTDADCVVDKNWLKELIRGFDKEDIAVCAGKILAFSTENWIERYVDKSQVFGQENSVNCDLIRNIPNIATANAMFRKDILEKIGYFDENLFNTEDTEISWRITFNGLKLKYVGGSIVYHRHRRNLWQLSRQYTEFGCGRYIIFRKYGIITDSIFSKLNFLFWLIKSIMLIPVRLMIAFICIKREEKINIFLDCLEQLSLHIGSLKSAVKDIGEPLSLSRQKELKNFYNHWKIVNNSHIRVLAEGVVWFLNDGVVKLLNFRNRSFYRLNQTATLIWQELLNNEEVSETSEIIARQFGISKDTALKDIEDLISNLEKESLLRKISLMKS